jgi:hypothetical protein
MLSLLHIYPGLQFAAGAASIPVNPALRIPQAKRISGRMQNND